MEHISRWATSWVAAAFVVLALLGVRYWDPSLTQILRLKNFDYLLTSQPVEASKEIVLVDVGEPTLAQWGQWPPKRDTFVKLIDQLRERGAGVIVFNVLFAEADRLGGDEAFAAKLKDGGIVIAQTVSPKGQKPDAVRRGVAKVGEDPHPWTFGWPGGVSPIPQLAESADGVGVIATTREVDGVTRRMPMIVRLGPELYPSLPLEIFRVAAGDPS